MDYKAFVKVQYKASVLEPQGQAIMLILKDQENHAIKNIRVGKYIEVKIEADSEEEAKQKVNQLTENLLYNPVMEMAEIDIFATKKGS